MIRNKYFQRYFACDSSDNDKQILAIDSASVIRSNSMYDKSKGLTHTFIHTNKGSKDDKVRLIGDVEICMSNDPSVTSEFSPMYRAQLRIGLVNSKGAGPNGLTDDELLNSIPCNVKFEREDAESISRQSLDRLSASIESFKKFSETQPPKETDPSSPAVPPSEITPSSL